MITSFDTSDGIAYFTISEIGSNHQALFMPNQDYVSYKYNKEDFVIVVSDGVGSCKNSADGSKYICEAVLEIFDSIIDEQCPFENEEILGRIIKSWKTKIGNDNVDDYCATAKFVIKRDLVMKMFSIGDGELVVTSAGNHIKAPNEHDFFSNITKCLCSSTEVDDFWTKDFRLDIQTDFVVLACTDGISNGIEEGSEIELAEEIEKHITANDLESELKRFIECISENSFDDKTVGVVKYGR